MGSLWSWGVCGVLIFSCPTEEDAERPVLVPSVVSYFVPSVMFPCATLTGLIWGGRRWGGKLVDMDRRYKNS